MNDDELLSRLSLAFAPEIGAGSVPPPQAMAALHRALSERSAGRRLPSRRRWMFALGGVAASLGASTAAFAAGVPVPAPLRTLAHDIGLPVDSTTLVDAKSKREELESAVERNDAAEAARLAGSLRADLAGLEDDERRQVEPAALALLDRADNLTGQRPTGSTGGQPPGTQPQGTQSSSEQPSPSQSGGPATSPASPTSDQQSGSSSAADALLSSPSSPFPATSSQAGGDSQGSAGTSTSSS